MTHQERDTLALIRAAVDAEAAAAPSAADLWSRTKSQVRRRRLGRGAVAGGAATSVVLVAVLIVVQLASRPAIDVMLDQGGADTASAELGFLDGTRLRLRLPQDLDVEASAREWAGSIYAAPSIAQVTGSTRGWRLDVLNGTLDQLMPRDPILEAPSSSSPASAVRVNHSQRRLGLQFGAHVAVVSGDALTESDIGLLLSGINLVETADGSAEYRGSLALWVADAPDVIVRGDNGLVSVFFRDCSTTSSQRTPAGLTLTRIFDQDRGSNLAVLCDVNSRVEIWLDTPAPVPDEDLARVDVQVLTVGVTLRAVQQGNHPGS